MSSDTPLATRMSGAFSVEHGALRTWLRLLGCTTLIERQIRRRLREDFDTTLPRFDVLAQLDAANRDSVQGLTMGELSRRLMVTNGNLTGLIERLVQEELVTRVTHPNDRRIQMVRLTPAGKRALDSMTPPHEDWVEKMFSTLSVEEREQLFALLGKLRNGVRESLGVGPHA